MPIKYVYTPTQVAEILQLNVNTVYELINKGEIIAKKLGKTYRISYSSISFAFDGLDLGIKQALEEDLKNMPKIRAAINEARGKKAKNIS